MPGGDHVEPTATAPGRPRRRAWTAHPALTVLEYHLAVYRQVWRGTAVSSFLLPLMFFLGMGVALGDYIDRDGTLGVPYLHFIAPGLLAFAAMQAAVMEAGTPVMNNLQWQRMYHVMVAAPPRVVDILAGFLGYVAVRVLVTAGVFLVVMLAFGVVTSAWVWTAPLLALLVGLAVAPAMLAFTASVTSSNLMGVMYRFGLLPMMLFAGVFFPVSQLPSALLPLVYVTPLWHAAELNRAAVSGIATTWPPVAHLAYLLFWMVAGFLLAKAAFTKRLAR